jgi:pSer/pThr/pTyr-binding forkhead associated (FHA) protein
MTSNRTQEVAEYGENTPAGGARTLVILADGRELDRVIKDRFLIGRGKHCDLIINSGKVSREHAAITREGGNYFIEDLGSSNGTWFDKRRISRRQIQDGDEYFICSEKLSCVFR